VFGNGVEDKVIVFISYLVMTDKIIKYIKKIILFKIYIVVKFIYLKIICFILFYFSLYRVLKLIIL
jgi:hypothetical protein